MSDAATLEEAPVDIQSVKASSQAAFNAASFVVALFEELWETDRETVTEEELRATAIEFGLVVEVPDPSVADGSAVFPELSDDLIAFVDTMSEDGDDTH